MDDSVNHTSLIDWSNSVTICDLNFITHNGRFEFIDSYIVFAIFSMFINLRDRHSGLIGSDIRSAHVSMGTGNWIYHTCKTQPMKSNIVGDEELTGPCSMMSYAGGAERSLAWYISVHHSLIINITIHSLQVAFSHYCRKYFIQLIDSHNSTQYSNLGIFCGFVQNELMYTKSNKAKIIYGISKNM